MSPAPLLAVQDLRVVFEGDRGSVTEAVSGVSFSLRAGRLQFYDSSAGRAILASW